MINLRYRSPKKELLDEDGIPFADIRQNMSELNTINKYLGGHSVTIAGLQSLVNNRKESATLHICEIGCGGGDNLQAINNYCSKKNIAVRFTGIDIKAACTTFAAEQYPILNANWIYSDYAKTNFGINKPDIIFSSLFCHHFEEKELIFMLRWMKANSKSGFFINDLHRHPMAYYSIKFITGLFSKSYLVKNDAPLSVCKGFTKKEWEQLFVAAGIPTYLIKWKWAFRHLIICKND